jgi:hypothetical protein
MPVQTIVRSSVVDINEFHLVLEVNITAYKPNAVIPCVVGL